MKSPKIFAAITSNNINGNLHSPDIIMDRKFSQVTKASLCQTPESSTIELFSPESWKLSGPETKAINRIREVKPNQIQSHYRPGKLSHLLSTEEGKLQLEFEVYFK